MRDKVVPLLEPAYSPEEISRYLEFEPDEACIKTLLEFGDETLKHIAIQAGGCVNLNSVWAMVIREQTDFPIHVVLGEMFIDDEHIYGKEMSDSDYRAMFTEGTENLDWDGHCWVSVGDLVGDASIIRTGKSRKSHQLIQRIVNEHLAKIGGEVFLAEYRHFANIGLRYELSGVYFGVRKLIGLD